MIVRTGVPNMVPMRTAVAKMQRAMAKGDVVSIIDFRWSGSCLLPMLPTNLIQVRPDSQAPRPFPSPKPR